MTSNNLIDNNLLSKLMSQHLFAGIDLNTLQSTILSLQELYLLKDEMLFRKGERYHKGIYFVTNGKIKLEKADATFYFICENDSVGITTFIGKNMYVTSARALEDSTVIFLPELQIYRLISLSTEFKHRIIKQIHERLVIFNNLKTNHLFYRDTQAIEEQIKSPILSVSTTITFPKLIKIFDAKKVNYIMVIGRKNSFKGIITKNKIISKLANSTNYNKINIKDLIDPSPLNFPMDLPIDTALNEFNNENKSYALVTDIDGTIGLVTKKTLLRATTESANIHIAAIHNLNTIENVSTYLKTMILSSQYILRSSRISREEIASLSLSHITIMRKIFNITTDDFAKSDKFILSNYNYSYLLIGPIARGESCLYPTACYAIILDDNTTDEQLNMFKIFSKKYISNLKRVGYLSKSCASDSYLNDHFIKRKSEWKEAIDAWFLDPDNSPEILFFILSDNYTLDGETTFKRELNKYILSYIESDQKILSKLVKTINIKLPISSSGGFIVESSGDFKDKINLFDNGIYYLATLSKLIAFHLKLKDLTTIERIRSSSKLDVLTFDLAARAIEAYDTIYATLLNEQINQALGGQVVTMYIEPSSLSQIYQEKLQRSFQLLSEYINFIKNFLTKI